jgi:hypothetical protein
MFRKGIITDEPEAVLMYHAYSRLARAYCDAYAALHLAMKKTAEMFGWRAFRIDQQDLRNYMDEYRVGRLTSEQKIPREEKMGVLQFIVFENLAGVPPDEARRLIRLSMRCVKYGYIYQVLNVVGAEKHYRETVRRYGEAAASFEMRIRRTLSALYYEAEAGKRTVTFDVSGVPEGKYVPAFLLPRYSWETGRIPSEIVLHAQPNLPVTPRHNLGALQTIYGPLGCGKTFLLNSIICYSVLRKHEVVLSPLNDKSNSFSLACMPQIAYSARTARLIEALRERLHTVEPQGIPTLTLNILVFCRRLKLITP